jgi:hypothetical protein
MMESDSLLSEKTEASFLTPNYILGNCIIATNESKTRDTQYPGGSPCNPGYPC